MVYSWKFKKPVAASVAGERLEELQRIHGEVTPRLILDDSRAEDAPLHRCFEWNDGKAAEAYRLHQAREILLSLTVTVEHEHGETTTRAFVNVANEDERDGRFLHLQTAMSKADTRQAVLTHAMMELAQFRRKYEGLQELADVFAAVDKLTRKQKKKEKAA